MIVFKYTSENDKTNIMPKSVFFQTSIAENSFEYLCRNRISVPSLKQYYSSGILYHCQDASPYPLMIDEAIHLGNKQILP